MKKSIVAAAALAAAALALSACAGTPASEPTGSSDPSGKSEAPYYDMLPDDVKESGALVVGTDPQFGPPQNFRPKENPSEWAGIEPDMLRALEPLLGVKMKWEEVKFETLIPGVRAGRYDLGVNSVTDTVERQKLVDMVDWQTGGNLLIVMKGNPEGIKEIADICGKPIALVKGSSDVQNLTRFSDEHCTDETGPMQIQTFPSRPDCILALQSGRVVTTPGGMGFSINLVHDFEGTGGELAEKFEIVDGLTYTPSGEPNFGGIAVSKDRPELRDALMAAVQHLMDDGTYDEIMDRWFWPKDQRLDEVLLNAATV